MFLNMTITSQRFKLLERTFLIIKRIHVLMERHFMSLHGLETVISYHGDELINAQD